jgi:N-acetylmuramoyl-L-alanine amidase
MKWYLDFGHDGKDSGALGSKNTKESDIVLKIGILVTNQY